VGIFLIDIIMIIRKYHAYKTIWVLFIIDLTSLPATSVLSVLNFNDWKLCKCHSTSFRQTCCYQLYSAIIKNCFNIRPRILNKTIVRLHWDFGNEIIITSVMNAVEEKNLYCCEALKMPHTMNKKCFYRSNYERIMKLWNFPIHFLWRSLLTTTLWSYHVDIKPDKWHAQMRHQSSQ